MYVNCYHKDCLLSAHAGCLAEKLCENGQVIPVSGPCPACKQDLLWGEVVRRLRQDELLLNQAQASQLSGSKKKKKKNTDSKKKKTGSHWSKELNVT